MERKEGFYWVMFSIPVDQNDWSVCYWNGQYWYVVNCEDAFYDSDFKEIQQYPIKQPPLPFVDKDMGHGKCMEKFCGKFSVINYNGHGYWVCQGCDDSLQSDFEDEYR